MEWKPRAHSANYTGDYLFNQLIPYIGNKRKLLGLIGKVLRTTEENFNNTDFVDLFAGTGVVSRYAKSLGFRVIANDWEPYSSVINQCYIETQFSPTYFAGKKTYEQVLQYLNSLPPLEDWVTRHLCPDSDQNYDVKRDRMFYQRKNGMRIDAIREQIAAWDTDGNLSPTQKACLLAPLIYSSCYNSNTSGVFKGFHNGWGGQTSTALYRIAGDLALRPAIFLDNYQDNRVIREDAQSVAINLSNYVKRSAIVYIDPPYNQHPYGSNYHVLNSVALWDKPVLAPKITGHGDKSAIRHDWRTERRSVYNHKGVAASAYIKLLKSLSVKWLATSYSTDGFIPLLELVQANQAVGKTTVFAQGYKRYRVSSQRFSEKPMNVELILLTKVGQRDTRSAEAVVNGIQDEEREVLAAHPEISERGQMDLF